MSVYMTEEEQLESIKKWWQRYNGIILTAVSILLLCFAGYRYWNWYQEKQTAQASISYEHLMVAFSNHDNKSIRSYANQLIENHGHSLYADVAHLTLAKLYVAKAQYDKAVDELQLVLKNSSMPALKQVAQIRLARVLAMKKSYSNALDALSKVTDDAYLPVINELRGDIYVATDEYKNAITSYMLAMDEVRNNGMGNVLLEMKINELAALTPGTSK